MEIKRKLNVIADLYRFRRVCQWCWCAFAERWAIHTYGLVVVDTVYENVEGSDGNNQVVQFTPRTREPMLAACLWSHWVDPAGKEPDLLSFAAITDDPEPEVAAAGHDRTIINIKPEHFDA